MEPTTEKSKKLCSLKFRKNSLLISVLLAAVLVLFIILISVLVVKHFAPEANIDINDADGSDDKKIKIVPRSEWIAQPPKEPLKPLQIPVPLVIILQTATTNCSIKVECILRTRWLQMNHIEVKNYKDIAYNFLIGGDGVAYEGRGWNKESVYSVGHKSIALALIGTYSKYSPTKMEISATQQLIRKGIGLGVIANDYKLMGHSDLLEPSGLGLLESLKSWPNWGGTID